MVERYVKKFADWLSQTSASLAIQQHEWVIPTVQSIHIIAIGIVLGSVFMINLRILGWAGRDQTMIHTWARFGPWLWSALGVLLVSGALMIVGEPARQLLSVSFWLKMGMVAIGTAISVVLHRSLAVHDRSPHVALAVVTLLIWACVVVLGRLIAYDYVWGSWSTVLKG
jgi:hypothetical protein